MQIDLDRDVEKVVNEEVQAGRFESAREFIDAAVKQFVIAREFGEEEARKLATLRAELQSADRQIDRGDCSDYNEETLCHLFEEIEAEGLRELADERGHQK
jgi:Arc/MetJ-type ribon-helix-helix transcriptional regulator